MEAVVTKVSAKNACVVRIDVISGDFVIARGWCRLSKEKAVGEPVECPKGYLPEMTESTNELGQVFHKIDWKVA